MTLPKFDGPLPLHAGFTYDQRDWKRARESFAKAAVASPKTTSLFYTRTVLRAQRLLRRRVEGLHPLNEITRATSQAFQASRRAEDDA